MPRRSRYEHLREEALRLRNESRMGTKEIVRQLGVPVSTLHYWLRKNPLTAREQSALRSKGRRYATPKKELHDGPGFPCRVAEGLMTTELGAIGESAVLYRFSLLGFRVAKAVGDGDVVDFYVRNPRGERVAFVQTRMATRSGPTGLPTISLRRNLNGKTLRFKRGDFHFLVGFCMENQSAYVFAYDEVSHLRNCVTVTPEAHEAWWKLEEWLGKGVSSTARSLNRRPPEREASGLAA